MIDKEPDEPRDIIELSASREIKQATASESRLPVGTSSAPAAQTPQRVPEGAAAGGLTGAALAAGVLTAVDEDEEEAPLPEEFQYESDDANKE